MDILFLLLNIYICAIVTVFANLKDHLIVKL